MDNSRYTETVYGLIKDQNYTEAIRILQVRAAKGRLGHRILWG